jgi:hypothetical protein
MAVVQGLVAGSERGRPIEGQVDRSRVRLADRPAGAHLVAVAHRPGWADHSWAAPSEAPA